jgi:hypothetical protein
MGRAETHHRLSRALASFLSLTALSLCAVACNNTCVFGALNSPGTTVTIKIGNPPPACNLATTNGAVHIEIGAATGTTSAEPAASANGMARTHITHLFVTLAGIDAHPALDADDSSPEWQPLAPQLNAHPLQFDLLAPHDAEGGSRPFPQALVPAGVYRLVRLRLAMRPSSGESLLEANQNEPVLETSACSTGFLHCAVTSDGRIQPLAFAAQSNLRIPPESMDGRWLHVLPDAAVSLRVEFDRDRSFLWPVGDDFRLIPQFHLRVQSVLPAPRPDVIPN